MYSIIEKHYRCNYHSIVKRVKYRVNGSEIDAEDVVQEAYYRALKYKDSFELGSPFNNWFMRIVSNTIKDWKAEQFNNTLHDEFEENDVEPIEDPQEALNLIKQISLEIDWLPRDEYQEVLKLHFLQGFRKVDIMHITNLKYKHIDKIIRLFKEQTKVKHD